jgi:hypothetical protein
MRFPYASLIEKSVSSKWILLLLFCVANVKSVSAASIDVVTVSAHGFGATKAEAISAAVVNGVAQINGEVIAASMRMQTRDFASSDGRETSERSIQETISRKTKGVVKGWRKISLTGTRGDFSSEVEVSVYKLKKSAQLDRLRVAVVAPENEANAATSSLIEEMTRLLTSSRKFAVLDRRRGKAIQNQLDRIRAGGALEDKARLAEEVAPDVIAVMEVVTRPNAKGRLIAEASIEVIDYATRQIKFAEKKRLPLKNGDDAANSRRMGMLAKSLYRIILETTYPPLIVAASGDVVTIGQGSDFFTNGDKVVIKLIGKTFRDPHTQEYLGSEQEDVAEAQVIYVDKRISKARLISQSRITIVNFVRSEYRVTRAGASVGSFFDLLEVDTSAKGSGKKKSLFATDSLEDEDD